jgi:predicted  nucleic acid-binding Zn-ribbon protein
MENNSRKNYKIHIFYLSVIFILLVALSYTTYRFFTVQKQKVYIEVKLKNTDSEKEKVTNDLQNLLTQYESLKTNNKKISGEIEEEKEKIKTLLNQIRSIKYANSLEIKKYEKELETMRDIMRSYIVQIDSLNTRNQILKDENFRVKTDIKKEKNLNEDLTSKNNDLSKQVDIASVIKTLNIVASALNEKGKAVTRVKKVDKIQICFTLSENLIAKKGPRLIYIRIARPDELVVNDSEDNLFNFEGKDIVYSAKREVEYEGKNTDVCIYWAKKQDLPAGIYNVDIFTDGKQIGTTTFSLK